MLRYFRRLEERAAELGNHRRKYLHTIDRWGRLLIDRLEDAGRFDRVHLRRAASDVGGEMDCVLEVGRDESEKRTLLGCYYAIQFLLLNIRSIDLLRLTAASGREPVAVYRDFLRQVGADYWELIRTYMARVLDLFLADGERQEFVVCAVGTVIHQDDVDLAVIDDGSPARRTLNRAIGRMAGEMMRWTSAPDFYLSEHVGAEGYTASIDEYGRRLDQGILDFISVSEILSASLVTGSLAHFERFQREIHSRYYPSRRERSREHEAYLRGLVGEIESFLCWPRVPERINPKDDLLRLIHATISAYRTIHRVRQADPIAALGALRTEVGEQRGQFEDLERHYTFVETFRHLYQQFAAQEEEIDLGDPDQRESLQQAAEVMGYRNTGVVQAWEHLLVHYIEHVEAGRRIVRTLKSHVCEHIRAITIFADWVRDGRSAGPGASQGLALAFLERAEYFERVKYWDDILEALEADECALLQRVVREMEESDDARWREIGERIVRWNPQTYYSILRILTALGANARRWRAAATVARINRGFLETIEGTADQIRRFSTVLAQDPALVHRYLSMLDEGQLSCLCERMSGEVWDSEVGAWRDRLCCLIQVHVQSSPLFRRAINRVCDEHPEYLLHFGELAKLARIAEGVLADASRFTSIEERKRNLALYYDLEYLRVGLATLQGKPQAVIDDEYTEFSDHLLEILFGLCKEEVDREWQRRIHTHDLLALFAAGAQGRQRAHQDDCDLIVLLDSDSDEIHRYANRIVARMNREIIRRGIMPQYRFADRFGGYVTRFAELESFLKGGAEDVFVEMSQLMGARLIVGSTRLENEFVRRIVEGCIYARKETYVRQLMGEIAARRTYSAQEGPCMAANIKEGPGGLRDLELAMLLWKVVDELREPISVGFWDVLGQRYPERRRDCRRLKESHVFLTRLRDVYRLSVAPDYELDESQFDRPARILGFVDQEEQLAGRQLALAYREHLARVTGLLGVLLAREPARGGAARRRE